MATFKPFRGIRYSERAVGGLERVVAPPYDVITPQERETLARRHPHNVVRLELPDAEGGLDKYAAAGSIWRQWLSAGILARDQKPAFYVCDQEFIFEGAECRRRAVFGRVLLEEFGKGAILPHEYTMGGPKADRMRLMEACRANLSPVFGLFPDPGGQFLEALDEMISRLPRAAEFTDWSGMRNTLWIVDDPEMTRAVSRAFEDKTLLIADGHHRYETALEYRNRYRPAGAPAGEAAADYVMMACVSMRDAGLKIIPTHRAVKVGPRFNWDGFIVSLCEDFRVVPAAGECGELLKSVRQGAGERMIGLYVGPGRGAYLLTLKDISRMAQAAPDKPQPWRELDVAILQKLILEKRIGLDGTVKTAEAQVLYSQNPEEIFNLVNSGVCELGFIINPTLVEQVRAVAESGERMPPKSTFFYPKLLTGIVFYQLGD